MEVTSAFATASAAGSQEPSLPPGRHSVDSPARHLRLVRREGSKVVGIVAPCYGYERVAWGLPVSDVDYRWLWRLPLQRLERRGTFFGNTPLVLDNSAALLHTWNSIPLHRAPFVTQLCHSPTKSSNRLTRFQSRCVYSGVSISHNQLMS